MDSLTEFLSACMLVDTESDIRVGNLTVLLQKDQPARMFDRSGHPQSFTVVPIDDPELLSEVDVAALTIYAEDSKWIVVTDCANQVRGVIEPWRTKDLQIIARAKIKSGEFGTIALPSDIVEVSVSYYGCPDHPEAGRFGLHQLGAPIPRCPYDGKPMIKLQEKDTHAKAK